MSAGTWTMTDAEFNRELAKAWKRGHESGFWNGRLSQLTVPYDAPRPDIGVEHANATNPYGSPS